jgi:hypothetical protein
MVPKTFADILAKQALMARNDRAKVPPWRRIPSAKPIKIMHRRGAKKVPNTCDCHISHPISQICEISGSLIIRQANQKIMHALIAWKAPPRSKFPSISLCVCQKIDVITPWQKMS